eukprot:Lithocolla_globosa_v1_NODE_310_length_4558_cov_56.456362.p3 type:complete len:278 gc:universal NODE_310_length_4558_cov_56.456362:1305-472(-)
MISKHRINNIVNQPVPDRASKLKPHQILGYSMYPTLYSGTYICACKKSGKSSTIWNILRECADKDTQVKVFCGTYENDSAWLEIRDYLDNKHIQCEFYTNIKEDGINHVAELYAEMKESTRVDKEDDDDDDSDDESGYIGGNSYITRIDDHILSVKIKEKKKKKKKKTSPKYIVIFDDMSKELRDPHVAQLLKEHRHVLSKVIISSQSFFDIHPDSRKNVDYFLLFGGIAEKKLQDLFDNINLNITFNQFMKMYQDATKEKHQFFYVSREECSYRKN